MPTSQQVAMSSVNGHGGAHSADKQVTLEEALAFKTKVKQSFADQPDVHTEFITLMNAFAAQKYAIQHHDSAVPVECVPVHK